MTTTKTLMGGDDVRAVVIDCGSSVIRLGLAGDDTPRAIIPSAVGFPFPSIPPSPSTAKTPPPATPGAFSPPPPPPPQQQQQKIPTDSGATTDARRLAGDILTSAPHLFHDIRSLYVHDAATGDATVNSWSDMTLAWRSAYDTLHLNPADSPALIVEPTRMWRDPDRAAALTHAFESLQVPAAYIARGAAMTAFASGRSTALVLDIGLQGAVAVPVIEGYPLQRSMRRSTVGGRYLTDSVRDWVERCLDARPGYDGLDRPPGKRMRGDHGRKDSLVRAPHELKRERVRDASVPAEGDVRKFVVTDLSSDKYAEGHREFYRLRVVDDLKAAILELGTTANGAAATANKEAAPADAASKQGSAAPGGGNAAAQKAKPPSGEGSVKSDDKDDKDSKDRQPKERNGLSGEHGREYTLPDGNILCLDERDGHELAECLYTSRPDSDMTSLTDLVFNCVTACDVDMRRDLFGSVVIAGGTTMVGGVVERLTRDLALAIPQAYKLKVHASPNATERLCAAWIGGSIVASLGTFQQAWVSKAEYDEQGAQNALRKCP